MALKVRNNCRTMITEWAPTWACLEGVRIATEWVHMPMIIELDNGNVVADLNTTSASRAEWGGIISEVQVHNIKRDSNRIAHALAQMALRSGIDAEWKLSAPAEILDLLNQECNPMFSH
uniref:RNase H type-1 domain-containing protein n=1 Tax=Oryza sativa subsp. japonica TaxID=39947 RepID=Q10EC1_ORYSJ|nr:hypothetical protein LOC_Os03g56170 [Oryza sativa Japonica Group]